MAETRAKARALRDAVNVGATALEELSDGESGGPPARHPDKESARSGELPVPWGLRRAAPEGAPADAEDRKAHQSQVDRLGRLAVELRRTDGAARLEERLGKPLAELTREEAKLWIERLSPEGETGASA